MQTGVLYGLWGCAITAYGFAFGGVVDFLGELLSLSWRWAHYVHTSFTSSNHCRGEEDSSNSVYLDRLWQVAALHNFIELTVQILA